MQSSVGLVNDQKRRRWIFQLFPAKGPAALSNNKQENKDQIQTENVVKQ